MPNDRSDAALRERMVIAEKAAADAWNSLPRCHEIMPNDVDCAGCPERRYRQEATR